MSLAHQQTRTLAALLAVVISFLLLLSSHSVKQDLTPPGRSHVKHLANLEPLSAIDHDTYLTSEHPRIVALPFGRQHHPIGFSSTPFSTTSRQAHVKRYLTQQWRCLVQKGRIYWEEGVLPAFAGQTQYQTPDFGEGEDVLNSLGWTSSEEDEEAETTPIPSYWDDALEATQFGKPTEDGLVYIKVEQDRSFENAYGQRQATGARYYAFYSLNGLIMVTDSFSPTYRLEKTFGIPTIDVPKYLSRLHQLSDVLWFQWDGYSSTPGSLRYYAVDGIINEVASDLIDEILEFRRPSNDVSWSDRVTFDLNSQEGKALLACPNGIAVAWLLIHHASELGPREPRVTIFNPRGNNRMMIWDLVPVGQQGSFGDVAEEAESSDEESNGD
ncbi:MAG: hypothetical protein Q9172_000842 [Xanthocarpia lactea]